MKIVNSEVRVGCAYFSLRDLIILRLNYQERIPVDDIAAMFQITPNRIRQRREVALTAVEDICGYTEMPSERVLRILPRQKDLPYPFAIEMSDMLDNIDSMIKPFLFS